MSECHIVITDGFTLNPGDLSWTDWEMLGSVSVYDHTLPEALLSRAATANALIVNKTPLSAATLAQLPRLRYIGVTATGYNNVDVAAARALGIPVCNVAGYGTQTVAQHVFALILALTNRVAAHHASVQNGDWGRQPHFAYTLNPIVELAGKTLGIYGFGAIAQAVARIGLAFGMRIVVHRRQHTEPLPDGIEAVSFETLLAQSDVLSLNAAMSAGNQGIINAAALRRMKPTALLINTARGGLVVEQDLKEALERGLIAGAGLDVLPVEPPTEGSVLFGVANCVITPHNAWASVEARKRLMAMALDNLRAFLAGNPKNVVNL